MIRLVVYSIIFRSNQTIRRVRYVCINIGTAVAIHIAINCSCQADYIPVGRALIGCCYMQMCLINRQLTIFNFLQVIVICIDPGNICFDCIAICINICCMVCAIFVNMVIIHINIADCRIGYACLALILFCYIAEPTSCKLGNLTIGCCRIVYRPSKNTLIDGQHAIRDVLAAFCVVNYIVAAFFSANRAYARIDHVAASLDMIRLVVYSIIFRSNQTIRRVRYVCINIGTAVAIHIAINFSCQADYIPVGRALIVCCYMQMCLINNNIPAAANAIINGINLACSLTLNRSIYNIITCIRSSICSCTPITIRFIISAKCTGNSCNRISIS